MPARTDIAFAVALGLLAATRVAFAQDDTPPAVPDSPSALPPEAQKALTPPAAPSGTPPGEGDAATLYEGPSGQQLERPSCLDQTIAGALGARLHRRGVQRKDFLKGHRFELTGHGGLYASDLLSSSYLYGGALAYYFFEDFGVEFNFDVTPVNLDLAKPLESFFQEARFKRSNAYVALGNFVWTPIHAKLKIGDSIVHSDIGVAFGGGRTFNDTVHGLTFDGGLGWKLYLSRWFTMRMDFRDDVMIQEALANQKVVNNVIATLGVSVWVPFGF